MPTRMEARIEMVEKSVAEIPITKTDVNEIKKSIIVLTKKIEDLLRGT